MDAPKSHAIALPTQAGLLALVIWSASVALVRGLSESVGALTSAALATALGGVAAMLFSHLRGTTLRRMIGLPWRYLLVCGGLFVAYEIAFYAAIGWSRTRQGAVVVGLANYLWPALTVAFAAPILRRRVTWLLIPGCLLAVGGTAVALLGGREYSFPGWGPLMLGVAAGVIWALYSNLVRRLGRPEAGAVPLFLLASSGCLLLLRLALPEGPPRWTPKGLAELAMLGIATQGLAYVFWEFGMRRGRNVLLGVSSYFLPLFSTFVSCLYLGVTPGTSLVVGALLVTAGAVASARAVR